MGKRMSMKDNKTCMWKGDSTVWKCWSWWRDDVERVLDGWIIQQQPRCSRGNIRIKTGFLNLWQMPKETWVVWTTQDSCWSLISNIWEQWSQPGVKMQSSPSPMRTHHWKMMETRAERKTLKITTEKPQKAQDSPDARQEVAQSTGQQVTAWTLFLFFHPLVCGRWVKPPWNSSLA